MNFKQFLEQSGYDSANLFQQFKLLTEAEKRRIQAALDFVVSEQLPAVVIGGIAVAHYADKARPLTPDIDFLTTHMQAVERQLKQHKIQFQSLAPLPGMQGIHVPSLEADFLEAFRLIDKYVFHAAIPQQVGGYTVPMVAPAVLTIIKFAVARQKDTEDAFLLLQSKSLSRESFLQHLHAMEQNKLLAQRGTGEASDPEVLESYVELIERQ